MAFALHHPQHCDISDYFANQIVPELRTAWGKEPLFYCLPGTEFSFRRGLDGRNLDLRFKSFSTGTEGKCLFLCYHGERRTEGSMEGELAAFYRLMTGMRRAAALGFQMRHDRPLDGREAIMISYAPVAGEMAEPG